MKCSLSKIVLRGERKAVDRKDNCGRATRPLEGMVEGFLMRGYSSLLDTVGRYFAG